MFSIKKDNYLDFKLTNKKYLQEELSDIYTYFFDTHFRDSMDEEYIYESDNFPRVELWEKACENCCHWSINDYNVAVYKYFKLCEKFS